MPALKGVQSRGERVHPRDFCSGNQGVRHKALCKQARTSCMDRFPQGETVCWGGKNVGFKFWLSWVWILIQLPGWPGASWELLGCRMRSVKWLNYPSPWFSILAILQNQLRHFKRKCRCLGSAPREVDLIWLGRGLDHTSFQSSPGGSFFRAAGT